MKIGLIACSANKKEGRDIPEVIYSLSTLNKYSVLYAKKYCDDYYFLSAKYGLLNKKDIIQKYDLTLNNFKIEDKKDWSDKVKESIIKTIQIDSELYILAGKNYYTYMIDSLEKNYKINKVFENFKGIGYILEFLKKETENNKKRLF